MSSNSSPQDREKRGFRLAIRNGIRWCRNTLTSRSPRTSKSVAAQEAGPQSFSRPDLSTSSPRTESPLPDHLSPEHAPEPPPEAPVEALSGSLLEPSPGPSPESALGATMATPRENKDTDNTPWGRLFAALHTFENITGLFSPLKSAVGAFAGCLGAVRTAATNRQEYELLADEIRMIVDFLKQHAAELGSETRNGSIANIARSVEDQVAYIQEQQSRGTLGRLIDATNDQEDVMQCYRQIERLFQQLQHDIAMRTRCDIKKQREMILLRGMLPVDEAIYNSSYSTTIKRRGCTAQTRESTQESLQKWAKDPASAKIYWMNGMAGTGKTTIAYSFCQWLEDNRRLGASFFCSRISSACGSTSRIVPTLAYHLALYSPAYRSELCAVLEKRQNAPALDVLNQFETLVHKPMLEAKDAMPDGVVVVIDALDECDDRSGVRLFLDVMFRFAPGLPLKFFVTSRPEYFVRDRMLSRAGANLSILHLHDIEQSLVEGDIKKYLNEALHSMSPPPSPWQIDSLAQRARNLFIYAATVVRYIHPEDFAVDSGARLELILMEQRTSNSELEDDDVKYEELDHLYNTVLGAAFNQRLSRKEKDCMQRVLWTIVCAKEPIALRTVTSFLSLTEPQVGSPLQSLRSVIHVPENLDTGLIFPLHASFPDYILNHSRSKAFHCNDSSYNELLLHRCFQTMESELQSIICELRCSHSQVEGRQTQATQFISPTLAYACRQWGQHLPLSPVSSTTCRMVHDFMANQLLAWTEALNFTGDIGSGAPAMSHVQAWLSQVEATVRRMESDDPER